MKHKRMIAIYKWLQTITSLLLVVSAILFVARVEGLDDVNLPKELITIITRYGIGFGILLLLLGLANYHKRLYRRSENSKFAKWFN